VYVGYGSPALCLCVFVLRRSIPGVDLALPPSPELAVEDRSSLLLATLSIRSGRIQLWDVEERKCVREWEVEGKEGYEVSSLSVSRVSGCVLSGLGGC